MAGIKIQWSSLLHLTELDFMPEEPKVLNVSDELAQCLSWLTGATLHDRKLIRCNDLGAILTGNAWDNLTSVETDELYPESGAPDSFTATVANKGILVASSTQIIKLDFVRISGGASESVYLSPDSLYFYPYPTYSVTANVVPDPDGIASYVGITAFN